MRPLEAERRQHIPGRPGESLDDGGISGYASFTAASA
jgi:hypothetical protein